MIERLGDILPRVNEYLRAMSCRMCDLSADCPHPQVPDLYDESVTK